MGIVFCAVAVVALCMLMAGWCVVLYAVCEEGKSNLTKAYECLKRD